MPNHKVIKQFLLHYVEKNIFYESFFFTKKQFHIVLDLGKKNCSTLSRLKNWHSAYSTGSIHIIRCYWWILFNEILAWQLASLSLYIYFVQKMSYHANLHNSWWSFARHNVVYSLVYINIVFVTETFTNL